LVSNITIEKRKTATFCDSIELPFIFFQLDL